MNKKIVLIVAIIAIVIAGFFLLSRGSSYNGDADTAAMEEDAMEGKEGMEGESMEGEDAKEDANNG